MLQMAPIMYEDVSTGARVMHTILHDQLDHRLRYDLEGPGSIDGRIYLVVTHEEMARMMAKSVASVKRYQKELEAKGFLLTERVKHGIAYCPTWPGYANVNSRFMTLGL